SPPYTEILGEPAFRRQTLTRFQHAFGEHFEETVRDVLDSAARLRPSWCDVILDRHRSKLHSIVSVGSAGCIEHSPEPASGYCCAACGSSSVTSMITPSGFPRTKQALRPRPPMKIRVSNWCGHSASAPSRSSTAKHR